jgi:hypothetical protein
MSTNETKPSGFSAEQRAYLEALTDDEAHAAARSDPDAQPANNAMLRRGQHGRTIRLAEEKRRKLAADVGSQDTDAKAALASSKAL